MVTKIVRSGIAGRVTETAAQAGQAAKQAARRATRSARKVVGGTLGITGERMSKVDTAWLRMDSDANLMMIVGVWVLKPGVSVEAVRERVQERLFKYPRFVQKVVEDPAGATWVHDKHLDIQQQVVVEKFARGKKQTQQSALQDRVAALATQPLDRKRPLWQMHLIENYQGGSALIVRIHHCIADGIALISVTQSLVDGGDAPPMRRKKAKAADTSEAAQDWLEDHLVSPLTQLAVRALSVAGEGAAKSLSVLADPAKGLEGGMDAARLAMKVAQDAAALVLMPDDSSTRLKGTPGTTKKVAWCAPIPLADVKAVGKAMNCSVNDVLLSCVAGAIASYLTGHGDDVKGKAIRAMVPVNLRPLDEAWKLGNQFGLAPVVLPIGMANPIERVYEVRRRMGELKGSLQPMLAFATLAIAGLMIKPAQDALLGMFSRKTTAVMTNVPGPRDKLKFCGSTLEESLFWVPQSGTVGMGVSILSYGGGVQFGVITDAGLCPDPQTIIDGFAPEFAQLHAMAKMFA
ncbi:MAG: hypothetical protein RLZZ126_1059 [Pseudomonadota bacterium]|jgi:diacylglycerol O-acyltransferase / wax synthase